MSSDDHLTTSERVKLRKSLDDKLDPPRVLIRPVLNGRGDLKADMTRRDVAGLPIASVEFLSKFSDI